MGRREYVVSQADAVRAPTYPLRYTLNVNAGPRRDTHVSVGGDPAHWFLLDVAMARQLATPLRGPRPSDLTGEPPTADALRARHDRGPRLDEDRVGAFLASVARRVDHRMPQ